MTEEEFLAAHGGPAGAQQQRPEVGMHVDDFLAAHGGPAQSTEQPTDSFTQRVMDNGGDIWGAQADVNAERQQRMDAEHEAWLADNANWQPQDWIEYHDELPFRISADAAASPELEARLIRANELATGTPYLGEGGRSQEEIDADLAEMQASGATNPLEYIQQQEATAGTQNLAARSVEAAGRGLYEGTEATIQGLLGQSNALRTGQEEAGYQEGVEQIKDKGSLIGEYMAGTVRGAAGSVGRMVPALALSAITKNPAGAYAIMGGQVGVDAYAQKESEGWSPVAAALYGAAAGGVEVATEVAGGKVAGGLGLTTAEEAFAGAAKRSVFSGVKNDRLRKAFEIAAGTLMEGGEEVAAAKLNYAKDIMAGIPPDQIQTEDGLKAFLGGVLAGGAMNTAAAGMEALTGPQTPQDATEAPVAPESPEAVGTPPEATQEAEPQPVGPEPEQATTETPTEQGAEATAAPGRAPSASPPAEAEAPGPVGVRQYTAKELRSVVPDDVPDDMMVEVDAIRAATGERVKIKQNAREAISEMDQSLATYKKLLACLGK